MLRNKKPPIKRPPNIIYDRRYKKYYNLDSALQHKSISNLFPFIIAHECNDKYWDEKSASYKIRTREFYGFDSFESFLSQRNLFPYSHEVMFNRYGDDKYVKLQGRLIFDFDITEKRYLYNSDNSVFVDDNFHVSTNSNNLTFVDNDFHTNIQNIIKEIFTTFYNNIDITKLEFVWLKSDTIKKWSKHLIVKHAYFSYDWVLQSQIFYQLMMFVAANSNKFKYFNNIEDLIDHQVAHNNATMRLYGSSKIGGNHLLFDESVNTKEYNVYDTTIQLFHSDSIDIEQEISFDAINRTIIEQNIINQHEHKKYLINVIKMLNGNNKNNDQTITIDDEDINDAIIQFDIFWCKYFNEPIQNTFKFKSSVGNIINLERLIPHECLLSGKIHDNENAFLKYNEDGCYFYCRRGCRTVNNITGICFAKFDMPINHIPDILIDIDHNDEDASEEDNEESDEL